MKVPIFLSNCKKYMRVEVQFRTIAMDFWASLEHKLKYKKEIDHSEEIAQELEACAWKSSAAWMKGCRRYATGLREGSRETESGL